LPLVDALLDGATVTVATRLSPPVTFDVSGALEGEPNLALRWLRPSVTVRRSGAILLRSEPYGPPGEGRLGFQLLLLILGGLLAWLLLRRGG
jgi:hypothetical protein